MPGLVSSAREAGAGVGHAPAGWQAEHRHCPAAPKFRLTQRIRDLKLLLTAVLHGPDPPIENMTPGASPSHPATPCRHRAVLGSGTEKAPCLHQAPPRDAADGARSRTRVEIHTRHVTHGRCEGLHNAITCRPGLEQETEAAPTPPVLLPGLAGGQGGAQRPSPSWEGARSGRELIPDPKPSGMGGVGSREAT